MNTSQSFLSKSGSANLNESIVAKKQRELSESSILNKNKQDLNKTIKKKYKSAVDKKQAAINDNKLSKANLTNYRVRDEEKMKARK